MSAEPATLLALFVAFGFRKIFAALDATFLDVRSFFAMFVISSVRGDRVRDPSAVFRAQHARCIVITTPVKGPESRVGGR